ncbi:MAG TPA: alpha/beta hydrolase-fold protein [Spirochaetota bacterium]|nr:alpha/beta hydrolase-fold protein [Spirochaetota bacterium]
MAKFFEFIYRINKNKKKDIKKIEEKTVKTLTTILSIFKRISKNKKVKIIPSGLPSTFIYNCKVCKKESILLKDERLKYKLLYIKDINNLTDDFIIFLHGTARDHTQWLEKNGFGDQFKEIFKDKHPAFASISVGMSYLIKDNLPFPYDVDLEKVFLEKIIPYIRNKLNKNGNIHLIGHSIGAFSAFNLGFKYPEIFKSVFAISPFLVKDSPFKSDFLYHKDAINNNPEWSYFIKYNLMYAFKDEDDWKMNNPYDLVDSIDSQKTPFIIITEAEKELIGFNENIFYFLEKLNNKGLKYHYYKVKGDHHKSDIREAYKNFYRYLIKD